MVKTVSNVQSSVLFAKSTSRVSAVGFQASSGG